MCTPICIGARMWGGVCEAVMLCPVDARAVGTWRDAGARLWGILACEAQGEAVPRFAYTPTCSPRLAHMATRSL